MDLQNSAAEVKKTGINRFLGVRHFQVLMYFLAITINLSIRVSMSISIVDMTDNIKDRYFPWSIKTQSVILSSFFWGYVTLQVPAGELATKYGGKSLLLTCVIGNSLVQMIVPKAAFCGGWQAVCACRIAQGLLQGWMLPTVHSLMAKWVPLPEKSSMVMFTYSGTPFGLAVQLLISGFIAHAWDWPAIYYISGAAGLLWSIVYCLIGADSPETSKMITDAEKKYIQHSLGQAEKRNKLPTPWRALLSSPAFIALTVAHIGYSWGMWTLMAEIPTYVSKVLGVNIRNNGVLSALPYITMTLMGVPFGCLSEFMLKQKLSVSGPRKISNSIAFFGTAISLVILSHVGTDVTVVITLLCIAVGMGAGHTTGFMLVHLDMAPNFAGTMMGITNSVSNIVAIMGPLATAAMLNDDTNQSEWRKLFYLTAGLCVVTNTVFVIFGTSERQPWNEPMDLKPSDDKSTEMQTPNIAVINVS